jgi:hypothetical protein
LQANQHPAQACAIIYRRDLTELEESNMEKQDVIRIAEGLRLIEEGVETIQGVMKEKNIKSLKDVAAELIPFFKKDDDSLTESIISHLE